MSGTTFIAFDPGATGPYAAAQLLSILNEADKCGADLYARFGLASAEQPSCVE